MMRPAWDVFRACIAVCFERAPRADGDGFDNGDTVSKLHKIRVHGFDAVLMCQGQKPFELGKFFSADVRDGAGGHVCERDHGLRFFRGHACAPSSYSTSTGVGSMFGEQNDTE